MAVSGEKETKVEALEGGTAASTNPVSESDSFRIVGLGLAPRAEVWFWVGQAGAYSLASP